MARLVEIKQVRPTKKEIPAAEKLEMPQPSALTARNGESDIVLSPSTASPRLCAVLQSLALNEYLEPLVAYGICSWDSLLNIQEVDFETLKFKLGHRRKLQREIAVSKKGLQRQEQLRRDDDVEQLVVDNGTSLPIRAEKRRKRQCEPTGGVDKRQFTSNFHLVHNRPSQFTGTEDRLLNSTLRYPLSEVHDGACMIRPPDVESTEYLSSSARIQDLDAMAMGALLDWDTNFTTFDSNWADSETSYLLNASPFAPPIEHSENANNMRGYEYDNISSFRERAGLQYLPQSFMRNKQFRIGDVQTFFKISPTLSQSQTSSNDRIYKANTLSYTCSAQDSASSSRSYSIPSADSEPGNGTSSEFTPSTQGEVGTGPMFQPLRYAVSLNAPTALLKFPGDESTTYLNRGQTYSIRVLDTAKLTPYSSYRTSIGLSFQDDQHRQDKETCWQTWSDVRGSQSSRNQDKLFQAVEFIDPARIGFGSSASFRIPQFELTESFIDGFALSWCPAPESSQEFVIALRLNFVSSDFSLLKGMGSSIAVRLCVKTEVLPSFPLNSIPSLEAEVCYSKFQLLREHGAARKQSDDLARIMKKIKEIKRKIATADSQAKHTSGALELHKHQTNECKDASSYSNRAAFRELQVSKLQSLVACSKSSKPTTSFDTKGERLDDPDTRPFASSDHKNYDRTFKNLGMFSWGHANAPLTPAATTISCLRPKISSKECLLPEGAPEIVACVYILPRMGEYDPQNNLHLAIYLELRTLDGFIQTVASKCNMLANQILRVVRINEQGIEMVLNDAMVCRMVHEQAMVAEFKDIGLPPNLNPSFADAAGFGGLQSRFFELRLIY